MYTLVEYQVTPHILHSEISGDPFTVEDPLIYMYYTLVEYQGLPHILHSGTPSQLRTPSMYYTLVEYQVTPHNYTKQWNIR